VSLLEDPDIWVRVAAAKGLGGIGGDEAAEALASHLETATGVFLLALVEVIGATAFPKALGPFLRLADHRDFEVRRTALAALSGYEGEAVERVLIAGLADTHWRVRKAAVEALGQRRTAAIDALLAKAAHEDPDAAVRQAAGEGLRR
jgi:HEAT repeat protein